MKTLIDLLDKEALDKAKSEEIPVNHNGFGGGNPVKISITVKKGKDEKTETEMLPSQLEACRYLHQCLMKVDVNLPIPEHSFVSRNYIRRAVNILTLKGIQIKTETAPVRKIIRNGIPA